MTKKNNTYVGKLFINVIKEDSEFLKKGDEYLRGFVSKSILDKDPIAMLNKEGKPIINKDGEELIGFPVVAFISQDGRSFNLKTDTPPNKNFHKKGGAPSVSKVSKATDVPY